MTAIAPSSSAPEVKAEQKPLFNSEREQEIARAAFAHIKHFERLSRSKDLKSPENLKKLVAQVQEATAPMQAALEGVGETVDVAEIVTKTIDLFIEKSIDIPKIVVVPKGEVTARFTAFDLDLKGVHLQPVAKDILIAHLHEQAQYRLVSGDGVVPEARLEDYPIRGLVDFDDICYDDHSELLYELAGQTVRHLQSYLKDEEAVRNVLQYHQSQLVSIIHSQMQDHYTETATSYEALVTRGFTTLRPNNYSVPAGESPRTFRAPVDDKLAIRGMLFGGFKKCLYASQRFQSDTERRFAVVLENDEDVLKWFKPARGDFQIDYRGGSAYEPDFVVETKTGKFVCEPKAADDMRDQTVLDKAESAAVWSEHATKHEAEHGGKRWSYLLIPHDVIAENKTFSWFVAACLKLSRAAEQTVSTRGI